MQRKSTAARWGQLGLLLLVCISSACRRSIISFLDTILVISMIYQYALSGKIGRGLLAAVFGISSLSFCGSIVATFVQSRVTFDLRSYN